MNAPFSEPRLAGPGALLKTDDEWRNINTMLNCILSMVEKTKRALAILQQRGNKKILLGRWVSVHSDVELWPIWTKSRVDTIHLANTKCSQPPRNLLSTSVYGLELKYMRMSFYLPKIKCQYHATNWVLIPLVR